MHIQYLVLNIQSFDRINKIDMIYLLPFRMKGKKIYEIMARMTASNLLRIDAVFSARPVAPADGTGVPL